MRRLSPPAETPGRPGAWPGIIETTLNHEDATMNRLSSLFAALFLSLLMAASAFAADKVNINTADAATLAATLNGVGPAKAEAIVAYRTENGPFRSADQLVEVRGIGLATVEKNRDKIIVSAAPAAPAPAR
jgi:competence protein ComEA